MTWVQPITDRAQSDIDNRTSKGFFNVSDWTRVDGNSDYIANLLALNNYKDPGLNTMTPPTSITIPTVDEVDDLIENIDLIRQVACLPPGLGLVELKYDYSGGANEDAPDFEDVNDWERNQLILAASIGKAVNYFVQCGTARVGQSRVYQNRWQQQTYISN